MREPDDWRPTRTVRAARIFGQTGLLLGLVLAVGLLGGCPSTPDPSPESRELLEALNRAKAMSAASGGAEVSREEDTPFITAAGSQTGDVATFENMTKTARENQAANTGPLQMAVQTQGDSTAVVQLVREAVQADLGVQLLRSQIEVLFPIWRQELRNSIETRNVAEGPRVLAFPDAGARADGLALQLEDLRADLNRQTAAAQAAWTETSVAAAAATKVDLAGMNIVSWNWNQGTGVGRDHVSLTPFEAAAMERAAAHAARVAIALRGDPDLADALGVPEPLPLEFLRNADGSLTLDANGEPVLVR